MNGRTLKQLQLNSRYSVIEYCNQLGINNQQFYRYLKGTKIPNTVKILASIIEKNRPQNLSDM